MADYNRRKQSVRHGEFAGFPCRTVVTTNHTPSWKCFGDGLAELKLIFYPGNRISVSASEVALANPNSKLRKAKRDHTKDVMMDLNEEAAKAIYDKLHERFG